MMMMYHLYLYMFMLSVSICVEGQKKPPKVAIVGAGNVTSV